MKSIRFAFSTLLALGLAAQIGTNAQDQYQLETLEIQVKEGNLSGTLTVPKSNSKIPVALIIAGSGATDQNGNSLGSPIQPNSYTLLAQELAAKGIATLRYDKRGIGKSRSNLSEVQLRFEDLATDASALLEKLKTDLRFSSFYIIGHSEGSLLGMLAAQQSPVTGYISLAGAGQAADEILIQQLSPQVSPSQLEEIKRVIGSLKKGQVIPAKDIALPAQLVTALFRDSVQPYLISWFRYDPSLEIKKLKTKIQILQGSTDIQVGLADANRLASAIGQQPIILEGMNHVFKTASLDSASQNRAYTDPKLPIAPSLVSNLERFVLGTP